MKKIININFQGRVIPIEETAYETLKQYVESLRMYFANEQGRDEIVNDIESRIAELFSERLKRGTNCITEDDVNAVMKSIGSPKDFEEQNGDVTENEKTESYKQTSQQQYTAGKATITRGRLHRNADDKIVGGVCSGLANYLGIDPVILRILFVILIGALFWIYILLWIIVPSQSLQTNITKRLYRNNDDKVIAGVCGGLASYFNIDKWVPRLVFALPLIFGLVSGTMNAVWWNWDFGFLPRLVTGSLGSTLFITYIILWIAVPYASTASEKLEMRGEKVDLNSIRDTVKEDLQNFKTKTEKWGQEVKETAQQFGTRATAFGQTASTQANTFASEISPLAKRAGSGLGSIIGMLFKGFFLFIAGIFALALFGILMAFLFGGMATFPLKNFVLEGAVQNILGWATLILFLGVPLIALITWLIRRIMGVRSSNHYLGYIFGGLWVVGLFSFIFLVGSFTRNFKTRMPVQDQVNFIQPSTDKLYVEVKTDHLEYYHGDWFGFRFNDDMPIYGSDMDTLMLNSIRVSVVKSKDSGFHVSRVRLSQGNTRDAAIKTADKIEFNIEQKDSLLILPEGFPISNKDKFRNQQVLVVIEVPIGKKIWVDDAIRQYSWFDININNRRGWNIDFNDYRDNDSFAWDTNTEYIMTGEGLKKVKDLDPDLLKKGQYKIIEENKYEEDYKEDDDDNNDNRYHYRYKQLKDSIREKVKETLREELKIKDSIERENKLKRVTQINVSQKNEKEMEEDEPLTGTHFLSPLLNFAQISN